LPAIKVKWMLRAKDWRVAASFAAQVDQLDPAGVKQPD
jgi:hypothetical protein